jgi:hypothetical protein
MTPPSLSKLTERSRCHWVFGIGIGQSLANGEAVAVAGGSLGELALIGQHDANFVVADRQIALPIGVGVVGLGEALDDGEAVLIMLQGPVEASLGAQDVADLVKTDGKVALPSVAGRVGVDEVLANGKASAAAGAVIAEIRATAVSMAFMVSPSG